MPQMRSTLSALRISLTYLVLGGLWIVLSDRAVDWLVRDPVRATAFQTWKGWAFVAATALLIYLLVRRALFRLHSEITEQQRLTEALSKAESTQHYLLSELDDIVWLFDVPSAKMLFVSAAVERIYGVSVRDFMDDPELWRRVIHPEDAHMAEAKLKILDSEGHADVEYRIMRPDGGVRWIRDRTRVLKDENGNITTLIGVGSDVSSVYQTAEHIHRLSNYDNLTGLPNRIMLEGLLQSALANARREGKRLGVLCVDIARLKDINDTFGHGTGDEVLKRVAERLRLALSSREIVARMGADEFAVVLSDLDDGALAGVAGQQILDDLAKPLPLKVGEVKVNASMGVSLFPVDADTPELLLRHADLALHHAKSRGVGQLSFYQSSMNAEVEERVIMASELARALERGELELFYQPQIRLSDGRVVGVEALIRWRHPQRGLVPPVRFVPLAEENGLIIPIGAWVLREACRQNRAWQEAGLPPIVVAVNVSAKQFREATLCDTVAQALTDSGLDAHWLELEVTESVIMDGAERMAALLNQLHALGVQLSIDDFGTGYSSLAYLTRFPVNKLKIDQAFVHGALQHERDATIVSTIIRMARGLHMNVIAEGVETPAQAAMLKASQCEEAQGFLYSRPIPAAEMERYLRQSFNLPDVSATAP